MLPATPLVRSAAPGELQGALTSLISATAIVGPLMMTNLFAYFTSKDAPFNFPGAPFIMGAILTILSMLFAMRSLAKFSRHEKFHPTGASTESATT